MIHTCRVCPQTPPPFIDNGLTVAILESVAGLVSQLPRLTTLHLQPIKLSPTTDSKAFMARVFGSHPALVDLRYEGCLEPTLISKPDHYVST